MKGQDLLEAIEYIDDELIEEALPDTVNKTLRPHRQYRKYMYTAAALAVVLGISAFAYSVFTPSKNTEMAAESGVAATDTSASEYAEDTVGNADTTVGNANTTEGNATAQNTATENAMDAGAASGGKNISGDPDTSAMAEDAEIKDKYAALEEDETEKNQIKSPKESHSEMMPTAIDGVTMEVTKLKGSTLTVTITNNTNKEIEAGDDYRIEYFDETERSWEDLDLIVDNAAFNAIAYTVPKDKPLKLEIDYSWFYGELAPGRYRVVKTIVDFRATGDYDQYTYHAEFTISQ